MSFSVVHEFRLTMKLDRAADRLSKSSVRSLSRQESITEVYERDLSPDNVMTFEFQIKITLQSALFLGGGMQWVTP
jgi:hypothetical protein